MKIRTKYSYNSEKFITKDYLNVFVSREQQFMPISVF